MIAAGFLVASIGTLPAVAGPVTIDFSGIPYAAFQPNNFNPSYFASAGLVFGNSYLTFTQGANALTSPSFGQSCPCEISGNFLTPVSSLTVDVALRSQGITAFVLTLYDASSVAIGTANLLLNQVASDPAYTGFGFFPIGLSGISRPAYSFTLDSQSVPGTFNAGAGAAFGASTFIFTPTPEPESLFLLGSGLILILAARARSQRSHAARRK